MEAELILPPPTVTEVLFQPIRARRGQTCCQVTSERPDLSERPEGRTKTLRRPGSADLVGSPSAERAEKSGGFHTSWAGTHQQPGGGGGGGGGADGWQTARVCRRPSEVPARPEEPPCSIWKARLAAACRSRADKSMLFLPVKMKVWRVAK